VPGDPQQRAQQSCRERDGDESDVLGAHAARPSEGAVPEGERRLGDGGDDDELGELLQVEGRDEDRLGRDRGEHLGRQHQERDRHQGRHEARLTGPEVEHSPQHA
jgi:hypothetical protein